MSSADTTSPAKRRSAEERREQIVEIAVRHFAVTGYAGTSTEAIAREAGISQPYLFRLFRTKRELFLACCDRNTERVLVTFRDAAEGLPQDQRMRAMGQAYSRLLEDRTTLLMQMQSYAATSDAEIRARARVNFKRVADLVTRLTAVPEAETWAFLATGMMLNVLASLDLKQVAGEDDWAARWSEPSTLLGWDDYDPCQANP